MKETCPINEYINTVCKVHEPILGCRYLGWSTERHKWYCAKLLPLAREVDRWVDEGVIEAKGDNCEGRFFE